MLQSTHTLDLPFLAGTSFVHEEATVAITLQALHGVTIGPR